MTLNSELSITELIYFAVIIWDEGKMDKYQSQEVHTEVHL
jgi:hypothetical protein